MSKYFKLFAVFFIAFLFCFGSSLVSFSEEKSEGVEKDMNDYLCKDVMRMTGEDRSVSLGILHGYMLGVKGTTKFNHQELLIITDRFVENCLDNPQSKALDVFKISYKPENDKKAK